MILFHFNLAEFDKYMLKVSQLSSQWRFDYSYKNEKSLKINKCSTTNVLLYYSNYKHPHKNWSFDEIQYNLKKIK